MTISKRRHQLASGRPIGKEIGGGSTAAAFSGATGSRPPGPIVVVEFHRHSINLSAGGRFVKVNKDAADSVKML